MGGESNITRGLVIREKISVIPSPGPGRSNPIFEAELTLSALTSDNKTNSEWAGTLARRANVTSEGSGQSTNAGQTASCCQLSFVQLRVRLTRPVPSGQHIRVHCLACLVKGAGSNYFQKFGP